MIILAGEKVLFSPKTPKTFLGSTQPRIQCVLVFFVGVKAGGA